MRRIALALASAGLLLGSMAGPTAAREPGQTIVDTAIAVNSSTW